MNSIFNAAIRVAEEQKTGISRLDIQFNYKDQEYIGHVTLMNGREYRLASQIYWMKED